MLSIICRWGMWHVDYPRTIEHRTLDMHSYKHMKHEKCIDHRYYTSVRIRTIERTMLSHGSTTRWSVTVGSRGFTKFATCLVVIISNINPNLEIEQKLVLPTEMFLLLFCLKIDISIFDLKQDSKILENSSFFFSTCRFSLQRNNLSYTKRAKNKNSQCL